MNAPNLKPITEDKDIADKPPPKKKRRLAPPTFESSFVGPLRHNRASSSGSHPHSSNNVGFFPKFQSDFVTTSKHGPAGFNTDSKSNPSPSPHLIIKPKRSNDVNNEIYFQEKLGIQDEAKTTNEKQKGKAPSIPRGGDTISAAFTKFASTFEVELPTTTRPKKYSSCFLSAPAGKGRSRLSTDVPIIFQDTVQKGQQHRGKDETTGEANSEPDKVSNGDPPGSGSESESRLKLADLRTLLERQASVKPLPFSHAFGLAQFKATDPKPSAASPFVARTPPDIRAVRHPDTSLSTPKSLRPFTAHLAQLNDIIVVAQQKSPGKADSVKKLVPFLLNLPPRSGPDSQLDEQAGAPSVPLVQHAEQLADSLRNHGKEQPLGTQLTELTRGIEISPQKHPKERGQRFIRGGLAERADHFFSKSSTSFSLWQTSLLKHLNNTREPPKEDLRLLILSITSFTKPAGGPAITSGPPRGAITMCREVLPDADPGGTQSHEGTVVFLFANHDKISSAKNFKEGRHVCVWRPWQEVDLPGMNGENALSAPGMLEVCVPPSSQDPGGRQAALFCCRFMVLD